MELRYSFVLFIGIFLILILILFRYRKSNVKYVSGKKVANTNFIKRNSYYVKLLKKYKILVFSIELILIFTIGLSFLLLSRPIYIEKVKNDKYNRDIFLCMDVSDSVNALNKEIVDALKDTVKSLDGDRFGISIFNTSSVVLVPLTDDYDYVLTVLDNISLSLDSDLPSDYIRSGTLEGNSIYGSSLVGDGLYSCISNFSNLEEDKDRSRIVILSTDNDVYPIAEPLYTLESSVKYAKKNNVIVYGIATANTKTEDMVTFRNAIELTDGELYEESSSDTVKDIVNNIEKTSKGLIEGKEQTIRTDMPQIPFILILCSTVIFFILNKKVMDHDN